MKTLIDAINKGNVTENQVSEMKQVVFAMFQKMLAGEAATADEVTINAYVTKLLTKAKTEGERQAEIEAKKAAAKAEYEKAMQDHELKVAEMFYAFISRITKVNKGKVEVIVQAANVKIALQEFIKTLPAEPKMPTIGKTSTGTKTESTGTRDRYAPVKTIKEGGTNWHIKNILLANDGITFDQLKEKVIAALPKDKPLAVIKQQLDYAVKKHTLPIDQDEKGGLHWVNETPAQSTQSTPAPATV